MRAFELAPTDDIAFLVEHGIDGDEFFQRELTPCWRDLTREERHREDRVVRAVREPARPLGPEQDNDGEQQLAELRPRCARRSCCSASAYDYQYGD